jgi:hypothetical protein
MKYGFINFNILSRDDQMMQVLQGVSLVEEYLLSMKREINISDSYAKQISYILHKFERFLVTNNGSNSNSELNWKKLSQQDIVSFLDSVRIPEPRDPCHKWIGTYNTYFITLLRFFKWLHHPD